MEKFNIEELKNSLDLKEFKEMIPKYLTEEKYDLYNLMQTIANDLTHYAEHIELTDLLKWLWRNEHRYNDFMTNYIKDIMKDRIYFTKFDLEHSILDCKKMLYMEELEENMDNIRLFYIYDYIQNNYKITELTKEQKSDLEKIDDYDFEYIIEQIKDIFEEVKLCER